MSIDWTIVGAKDVKLKKALGVVLAIAAGVIALLGASSWTSANDGDLQAPAKQWLAGERTTARGWTPVEPFVFHVEVAPVEGGWRVTWEAQLSGDYNQDGVVNIMDLTPLAAHFNESVADNPSLIVVDGNGDGVVDIMDISPLAAHFGETLSGFEIQLAEDEYQYPYATVATVNFTEHLLPPDGRLRYEKVIQTDMVSGYLCVKCLVDPEVDLITDVIVPLPGTE